MISILLHVVIALTSVAVATLLVIRPSRRLIPVNYGFIAATVATGTYLLIEFPAHLAPSCVTGIAYLAVATTLTIIAHVRLRQLAR